MTTLVTPKVEVFFDLSEVNGGGFLTLDDAVRGQLDDVNYVLSGDLSTDVTAYVHDFTITRGRSRELDEINAGTATVKLRNYSGDFVPDGFLDRYLRDEFGVVLTDGFGESLTITRVFGFDNVTVGKRCRISADGAVLFDGNIDDWNFTYNASGFVDCDFVGVDALANLAAMDFDEWTTTGPQTAGPRLTAILDRPEVAYSSNRDIATGVSTLASDLVTWGSNVLNYAQLVVRSDLGRLFASRTGVLTFKDRHALVNPTVKAAFADDGTGIAFSGIEPGFGSELLYNRVGVDREGGVLQTVNNVASQVKYRIRSLSLGGLLLNSDDQSLSMAEWLSGIYGEPQARIAGLTVIVDSLTTSQRTAVLSLDVADVVSVLWTAVGTSGSGASTYVVEGVSHSHPHDGLHTMNLRLSPVSQGEAFILDDTVLGVLDSGVLAF